MESTGLTWDEYLKSPAWYRLKDKAMVRAGFQCEAIHNGVRCDEISHLDCHHDKYPEKPEDDCLENVRVLCVKDHIQFHKDHPEVGHAPQVTK
jgi:hypothetical protein